MDDIYDEATLRQEDTWLHNYAGQISIKGLSHARKYISIQNQPFMGSGSE